MYNSGFRLNLAGCLIFVLVACGHLVGPVSAWALGSWAMGIFYDPTPTNDQYNYNATKPDAPTHGDVHNHFYNVNQTTTVIEVLDLTGRRLSDITGKIDHLVTETDSVKEIAITTKESQLSMANRLKALEMTVERILLNVATVDHKTDRHEIASKERHEDVMDFLRALKKWLVEELPRALKTFPETYLATIRFFGVIFYALWRAPRFDWSLFVVCSTFCGLDLIQANTNWVLAVEFAAWFIPSMAQDLAKLAVSVLMFFIYKYFIDGLAEMIRLADIDRNSAETKDEVSLLRTSINDLRATLYTFIRKVVSSSVDSNPPATVPVVSKSPKPASLSIPADAPALVDVSHEGQQQQEDEDEKSPPQSPVLASLPRADADPFRSNSPNVYLAGKRVTPVQHIPPVVPASPLASSKPSAAAGLPKPANAFTLRMMKSFDDIRRQEEEEERLLSE